MSSRVVSNYTMCLVAYALALGRSTVLDRVLSELSRRADYKGDSEYVLLHKKMQNCNGDAILTKSNPHSCEKILELTFM